MHTRTLMRLLPLLLGLLVTTGLACAQQMSVFPKFDARLSIQNDELLEPDEAFNPTAAVRNASTVLIQFKPTFGHYIYRHRLSFTVVNADGISVSSIELPPGELKTNDPTFDQVMIFQQPFSAVVNLKREFGSPNQLKLQATYVGCDEKGIRYPPVTKTFDLVLTEQ